MNYHADDCEEQLLESHPGTLIDLRERTNMIQLAGSYRQALAHFCALHHVGVFPSIHPEAFGIVAAEMMASGLVVVSSGVGGAAELVEDGRTGLRFQAGHSKGLADCLMRLVRNAALLNELRQTGQQEARQRFSVMAAAAALEDGFRPNIDRHLGAMVF